VQRLAERVQYPQPDDEGSGWLDLDENSTAEEVEAAYRNTFERAAARPQSLALRTPAVIQTCPLDARWRRWDMFGDRADDFRLLDPDDFGRCAAARQAKPVTHIGVVRLDWEAAPDTESRGESSRHPAGAPLHFHAEAMVDGVLVHVDLVDVRKEGPGRSIREVRVFVDGTLAGRGGRCGCSLGFGGGDLPAVARIAPDRVLTVDSVGTPAILVAELWEVGEAGN
jgi:hypothetical protein